MPWPTTAVDRKIDLLVVGNRGLNSLAGRLLGSVPANITHKAACDVLIVHTTGKGAEVTGRALTADPAVEPLRAPVMVAAFEGWNDAGDAATGAVEHLGEVWDAERGRRASTRTTTTTSRSTGRRSPRGRRDPPHHLADHALPRSAGCPAAERDLVLVRGVEPNMRWRGFCQEILASRQQPWASPQVVTLGALLADTPHTRPVPVSGTSSDPGLAARLGLEHCRYEGPTGIVGVLQDACEKAGVPAVSFWAAVPHYVAPAALPEGDDRAAAPGRGPARRRGPAGRPARARRASGSGRSTSSPPRTPTSRSTSPPSRSASPRPTCPRRPARRSRRSSSASCGGRTASRACAGRTLGRLRAVDAEQRVDDVALTSAGAAVSSPPCRRTRRRPPPAPRGVEVVVQQRRVRRRAARAPSGPAAPRGACAPAAPAAARPPPSSSAVHSRSAR